MTLVVGYEILKQLGMVFWMDALDAQIGIALKCECGISIHLMHIRLRWLVDSLHLTARSCSRRPHLNLAKTMNNTCSGFICLFGPRFEDSGVTELSFLVFDPLGPVVQKPINANLGLNLLNLGLNFNPRLLCVVQS